MISRAGLLTAASILAMACSGGGGGGGTGGAGTAGPGGGNQGGNNQPGSTLTASLGTQQAPNSTERAANSTEHAPSAVDQAPNSTEQAPNATDQAGGDCNGVCQDIAAHCAGQEVTADDLAECAAFCEEAGAGGCNAEFVAVFRCVAEIACSGEEVNEETFASPDSPCYDALLALAECDPSFGEGDVVVGGDNGGGNGGGEGGQPSVPGGGGGSCAALQACCNSLPAEQAPQCQETYNGVMAGGDVACNGALSIYQASQLCP
jgi:hypothetical protein